MEDVRYDMLDAKYDDKLRAKVADHYKISVNDMFSKRRYRNVVRARHAYIYFLKNKLNVVPYAIQRYMYKMGTPGFHHANISHAIKTFSNDMETNKTIQRQYEELEHKLIRHQEKTFKLKSEKRVDLEEFLRWQQNIYHKPFDVDIGEQISDYEEFLFS